MTVKLTGSLPEGEANGLKALREDLIRDPMDLRLVVVLIDTNSLTTDMDSGDVIPTARVRRIEPITRGDDIGVVRRVMARAHEERTGKTVLPYDLEWSLRGAVDPETGEIS